MSIKTCVDEVIRPASPLESQQDVLITRFGGESTHAVMSISCCDSRGEAGLFTPKRLELKPKDAFSVCKRKCILSSFTEQVVRHVPHVVTSCIHAC